jgi:hypothetical protein
MVFRGSTVLDNTKVAFWSKRDRFEMDEPADLR